MITPPWWTGWVVEAAFACALLAFVLIVLWLVVQDIRKKGR